MKKTRADARNGSGATSSHESAHAGGLRYVTDSTPGIRREKRGEAFIFFDVRGRSLKDRETVARIKALAIPPAWRDVWICPAANGHLLATGRDARGRKQHRYHPKWREIRDETKFNRMLAFARALPAIRRRIARDMRKTALSREKVLATLIRLLESSLIRVGNEEYARANRSFGLTTMLDRHARISGSTVEFQFRGKSGKQHSIGLDDRRLATIVKKCQDLPGQQLFQFVDQDGHVRDVGSSDVNDYLREVTGADFTAKDFRTWAGTVLAVLALRECEKVDSKAKAKKNILRAIEHVAGRLGNTPAICRKSYIHPMVFDAYLDGSMLKTTRQRVRRELIDSIRDLTPEEAAVLTLLERRLADTKSGLLLRRQLKESIGQARRKRRR
ncbi:MAG: DNA topoisomerase IB [Verrucomicrobiales bacterium]